ncbi:MAG: hypothetical protein ACI4WZ_00625 [Eubacteriales bacterium]
MPRRTSQICIGVPCPHDELMADESGKYYELWHAQAQYYTE